MKNVLTAIILLLVVICATTAFAGDTTVNFNTPTVVNGTKLAPGQYTLKYEVKGKAAEITVLQNKKTVATATGEVVDSKDPIRYDGVVRENKADGTASLKEIQVANKKQIIKLEAGETAVGK